MIAIELLAAVMAIRHRLGGLRRSGEYHPVGTEVLGKGTRAVWEALGEAAGEIFDIPMRRDAVYYPYIEKMVDVVRSGHLIDGLRQSGIRLKGVRAYSEISDD